MSFSQDSKFFRAVFSVLALLVGNDRHREVNAADVSWAEAGASLAASNYGLLTEEDVKFYRNPPNYGVFEEYVTLPPTGVLMPPVEFNGDGKMAKIELEGGLGRCNDGSNPVYYIAYGKQTTKWVLFLEVSCRARVTAATAAACCRIGNAVPSPGAAAGWLRTKSPHQR